MEKEKNLVHELLTSWQGLHHHQDGKTAMVRRQGIEHGRRREERRAFAGPHSKYDE